MPTSTPMPYLIRRALHGLMLLVGVSILSFVLAQLAPGEFYQSMRLDPRVSPQTVAALRSRYGMDRPLPARYLLWLRSVAVGDMGFSLAYNAPVASLLGPRVINTLILAVPSVLLAWLVAVPAGVWSAAGRGTWRDKTLSAGTSTLLAIPDLVMALGLLLFAVRTGRFPSGGMHSVGWSELSSWARARDLGAHLLLPCMALTLAILPVLVRHVRASVVETLDAPFVRTAVAHGIPWRRILWRHVLPAAANPLITLLGLTAGSLLSTSLLVEVVMSWPGLGPMILEAILARDVYLVIGAVVFSTLLLLAGNYLADLLLYAADPRIRKGQA